MTECRGNTFGIDCKQICGNCKNGEQCHEVNGSCPNGCNEGATGVNCDIGIWHLISLCKVQCMPVSKQGCKNVGMTLSWQTIGLW